MTKLSVGMVFYYFHSKDHGLSSYKVMLVFCQGVQKDHFFLLNFATEQDYIATEHYNLKHWITMEHVDNRILVRGRRRLFTSKIPLLPSGNIWLFLPLSTFK